MKEDEALRQVLVCSATDIREDIGPTILSPDDVYKFFETHPEDCAIFGIFTLQDADQFVMEMYIQESWPERLKGKK